MHDVVCSNCSSVNLSTVPTYKHYWHGCNDCGTVHRERRARYPLDIPPVRTLITRTILNRIFGRTLLPVPEVVEEGRKYYDFYAQAAAAGAAGTKWEPLTNRRLADFAKHGIEVAGKSVLEISGGPGFLAKAMQAVAERVVVTEFSEQAAEGMALSLGIEAVKYDYNSDSLEQCVIGPFDVVLIIYSIGFCNDLRAFAHALKAVMHDNSVIYVCHSPATLGLMVRWEFDDYTFNRCWELETMARRFAEIGYPERVREDEGSYAYDFDWYDRAGTAVGTVLKRLHRSIGRYYLRRALRSTSSINRELVQKNIKQIFGKIHGA